MSVTQRATNDGRGARVSGIDEEPDRRGEGKEPDRGLSDRCKWKDEKLKRRVSDRSKERREARQKSGMDGKERREAL